jgi:hypothetical protein
LFPPWVTKKKKINYSSTRIFDGRCPRLADDAAFLQNAGLFSGLIPRVGTLGWYAMPRQGIRSETSFVPVRASSFRPPITQEPLPLSGPEISRF